LYQLLADDAHLPGIGSKLREPYLRDMKTILWATLTANGNYARSTPEHPPKREALADFAANVGRTGNFIVGRRTFEEFQAQPARGGDQPFAQTDIVVVTTSDLQLPGVTCVKTPRAALEHLERRGHESALIAGGETLHNAFLAEDLVDELVFDIAPTFEEQGLNVVLPPGRYRELRLLGVKELGSGVVQLHYSIGQR